MKKVGFIGWRGMVGSVLMERLIAENNFANINPCFFSTSQAGENGPDIGQGPLPLYDAYDIKELKKCDILVTCQGSDYTKTIYKNLRTDSWKGYFIDAASLLRMEKDSVIVLDPVNRHVIDEALSSGIKDFIGGNCTVSLMLMAIGGLFKQGLVEWMTSMTYQAASGAGAKNMRELLNQMSYISDNVKSLSLNDKFPILDLDRKVTETIKDSNFPTDNFLAPLAGSAIPWIDSLVDKGQTKEEWKGFAETNKILQTKTPINIDGICVRIGAMRCHSQALTIKLNKDVPLNDIENIIASSNEWVKLIPNTKQDTLEKLTPAAVSGSLFVPIGRLRKLNIGGEFLTAFTVGDQLLWGAAEPLRRVLEIILKYLEK